MGGERPKFCSQYAPHPPLLLYKRDFLHPPALCTECPHPHLTVHIYLAPSGPWFTAGLGLQPADLRDDLSPELTLVLRTIRPLPGLSSPCGTVLSPVRLP